jgi:hypothetical protein
MRPARKAIRLLRQHIGQFGQPFGILLQRLTDFFIGAFGVIPAFQRLVCPREQQPALRIRGIFRQLLFELGDQIGNFPGRQRVAFGIRQHRGWRAQHCIQTSRQRRHQQQQKHCGTPRAHWRTLPGFCGCG